MKACGKEEIGVDSSLLTNVSLPAEGHLAEGPLADKVGRHFKKTE